MMILRSSPSSPFARKARIGASVLGLASKIDVREVDLNDPADSLRAQNPLGKIPALIMEDGTAWYDSRVILEVLDHLAGGGRIVPREPMARFEALRLQALCDGGLDAGVLIVYESRYRPPEMRVDAWVERQADKIARALKALEAAPPKLTDPPDVGQIALACLLGYQRSALRRHVAQGHPKLVAWLDKFAAQVPAFAETEGGRRRTQKPRRFSRRGFAVLVTSVSSELVVDAAAHDVGGEVGVGAGDRAAAAEVDVQIFDLRRPRPRDMEFAPPPAAQPALVSSALPTPAMSVLMLPTARPPVT